MTPDRVVVVDLETTGLDYKLDRILEIGAVRLAHGEPVAEFHALINPGVELRPENVAVHGIRPDMVADAPGLADVLPGFLAFLGADPLVAHNATFDFNFLRHHARETLGVEVSTPVIDTLEWAREVFPRERGLSLARLLELYGEPPGDLHRAMVDAKALASIFPRLAKAREERREYQRSQFSRIDHVAARFRDLGRLIGLMQTEFKELRRTLEVYFEETEHDTIVLPGGDMLKSQSHESHEFHAEETRAVLQELGVLDRVLRLDRDKLERMLKDDRFTEEQREALLATRRYLGTRLIMSWERPAADAES